MQVWTQEPFHSMSLSLSSSLGGASRASHEPDLWKPGDVLFGKIEILDVVGKGGMGSVYRVRHWEWDQELAVKVPHKRLTEDEEARERWVVEAQTWIELGVHPNIVQCWFVREWNDIPLLFLSYLAGGSLGEWMRANRDRDLETVLDYAVQACDGLAYAHAQGLIHRDVKPANLLLDGEGRLQVTDFGLVKRAASEDTGGAEHEGSAEDTGLLGTPSHAPPEQWVAGTIGPPADVYALGVVMFEMVAGRLPFQPTSPATALHDLLTGHFSLPPPDPRQFRQDCPEALSAAILACLAKEPSARPALAELRERLSSLQRDPRSQPKASPQRADALNNKAVSLSYLRKAREAEEAWNQAATLDSLHAESVYNRTSLQWRAGALETAEARRRLIQVQADRPWAGAYLGYFSLEQGLPEQAEKELGAALKRPEIASDGTAWRALGDALMCQSRFAEAEQAYDKARERCPADRDVQIRMQLAQAHQRGQHNEIYFPLTGPVRHWTLPTKVWELAFHKKRMLARHELGMECFDVVSGDSVWSAVCQDRDQGLLLTENWVVSGRECWEVASGNCSVLAPGERAVAAVPGTDQILAAAQGVLRLVRLPDGGSVRSLRGSEGQVLAAAVTYDGNLAVTGGSDRVVRVWELRTGGCRAELAGHKDHITAVLVTFDAQLAVTGGKDGLVRLWRLPGGEREGILEQRGEVFSLALASDGQHLVVNHLAEGRMAVSIWDVRARTCLYTGPGRSRAIPGCPWLLTSGFGAGDQLQGLQLRQIHSGWVARSFTPCEKPPERICGSQGGVWVACAHGPEVHVWEADETHRVVERSLVVTRVRGHREGEEDRRLFVSRLEASHEQLAVGNGVEAYRLLREARQVRGYDRDPEALELLGRMLTVLPRGPLRGGWEVKSFREPSGERVEATLVAGNLALSAAGRTARLWDPRSGSNVRSFSGHRNKITCLALGPEGELLTGSLDGTVKVWELATGASQGELGPHESGVIAVHMLRDRVLTVTAAGQVRSFTPGAPKPQVVTMLPEDSQVSFAPDGSWLAFVAGDRMAALALSQRARPVTLRRGTGWPAMVDGRHALFATPEGTVELVANGKAVASFTGGPMAGLGIAENRRYAVTLGQDNVKLWRVNPLGLLGQLALGRAITASLTDSARYLLIGCADGTLRYWELDWELAPPAPSGGWFGRLFKGWRK